MQYTDRFGNSIRNDGGPGSGPQGGQQKASTINKINAILKTTDYRGISRGTIVSVDNDDDKKYLVRHKIICLAGDRYVLSY